MAWSTPGTVAPGEVYTSSRYNTDTVGNLEYLKTEVDSLFVPPAVKCTRATDLNPYTNNTDIAWTSEEYDTDGMHDNSTNNARITPATAGLYLIVFSYAITFSGTSTFSEPRVLKNGNPLALSLKDVTRVTSHEDIISFVDYANGTTDYYTARTNFGGGTSLVIKNSVSSYFSATWIGRTS